MSWITRLKNALNSHRLDGDLTDEINDHLARRTEDLESQGLPNDEARRRAVRIFGNATALREESRELRLSVALEGIMQDTRYAIRGFLRNPAFALTGILSLGLAIGANTAIYSIIDAVLLRPLALPQPDRLATLSTSEKTETFSYPLYEQLAASAGDTARIALFGTPNRVEAQAGSTDAQRENVMTEFISPNAFDVLGVPPALGRLFSPAEDRYPMPRPVIVLSHDYWLRRFAADPSIIGQRLMVGGRTFTIIGVARAGFSGVQPGKFIDVWLPITLSDPGIFTNPDFKDFHLLARLGPNATRQQLAARLQPAFHNHQVARTGTGPALPQSMQRQLTEMEIQANSGESGLSPIKRTYAQPLWILQIVAGGILLISCANLASLLLARSTARTTEMAMRVSLGASRIRLIRQLMTESLLISAAAGLAGWLLARIAAPVLVAMLSKTTDPIRLDLGIDARVLLFCLVLCTLSAVAFGLIPAWQATTAPPLSALRHAGGQVGRLRVSRFFVAIQVAFALCLVTGGTGFLFSLRNLALVDTGFDPRGVTVLSMATDTPQRERQLALLQQIQARVAAQPNVQATSAAWLALFSGARRAQRISLPAGQLGEHEETFYRVAPGYFATLHTPLLRGRDLTLRDNDNEPVPAVVNLAFARKYFGTDSIVGREFFRDDGVRHQVIGVAANSHYGDLRSGPEPIVYMPMKPPRAFTLYVRSPLDASSIGKIVQREASTLGSGLRVQNAVALDSLVGSTILKEKLLAAVSGVFAFLGLILAAIGVFGLLNYSVMRRTKEIGIRTALGARRTLIYSLILKDLIGMIAGGMLVGIIGSIALMRFAQSLLFGIQPADPLVIGTSMFAFLGIALVAGGLPARRGAAIDPMTALRQE